MGASTMEIFISRGVSIFLHAVYKTFVKFLWKGDTKNIRWTKKVSNVNKETTSFYPNEDGVESVVRKNYFSIGSAGKFVFFSIIFNSNQNLTSKTKEIEWLWILILNYLNEGLGFNIQFFLN